MTGLKTNWTKLIGSSQDETGGHVAIDKDGSVYITGSSTGDLDGQGNKGGADIFISKFDINGRHWTTCLRAT